MAVADNLDCIRFVADNSDCIRPSVKVAHSGYASTDDIKLMESWYNHSIIGALVPNVYATRWAPLGSPCISLRKAMALHQET